MGQKLNLTIVNVDTERKRLGLSIISSGKPKSTENEESPSEISQEETTSEGIDSNNLDETSNIE